MTADSMRNYMILLESVLEQAPAAPPVIHAASPADIPADVLQRLSTQEAVSPDQAVQLNQTMKSAKAAELAAAVAPVTKVIDYLISTPTAYQKKLIRIQYVGKSALGKHPDDVLELHIPWQVSSFVGPLPDDTGVIITIAGQQSKLIPFTKGQIIDVIQKIYKDAGWTNIGPLRGVEINYGHGLATDEIILRAYKPEQIASK